LVEHRPDVRQAEENLHFASAQIGVAIANRLPSFALTADAGTMAVEVAHIVTAGFWDIGAAGLGTISDGRTLSHRELAAKAAYTEAEAQYRSVVLTAFQNVADSLHSIQQDAETLKAASSAKTAASMTLELASLHYQSGYANYLTLLSAEQTYQQAVLTLVQAQANGMQIRPRCFNLSAEDGGTAPIFRRANHDRDSRIWRNERPEPAKLTRHNSQVFRLCRPAGHNIRPSAFKLLSDGGGASILSPINKKESAHSRSKNK
jgi:hypothetical protein